jgi:hypothetical protein
MGRSQHIPPRARAERRLAADHLNCWFHPFGAIRICWFVRDGDIIDALIGASVKRFI